MKSAPPLLFSCENNKMFPCVDDGSVTPKDSCSPDYTWAVISSEQRCEFEGKGPSLLCRQGWMVWANSEARDAGNPEGQLILILILIGLGIPWTTSCTINSSS